MGETVEVPARLAAAVLVGVAPLLIAMPSAQAAPTQEISYRGLSIDVPSSWRVVNLEQNPDACVRFDVPTAYLGPLGTQADCPARLVGVGDTVWLHPAVQRPAATEGARVAHLAAAPTALAGAHEVSVETTTADESSAVAHALATLRETSAAPTVTGVVAEPRAIDSSTTESSSRTVSPRASVASSMTGMGFDQCAAPSAASMNAWLQSPYRSVGIYIGGTNRACAQPNLTSSWVSQVKGMGWAMVPIYVGLQAPCYTHGGSKMSTSQASQQGKSAADDAASKADALSLGSGSPIYFDLEAYPSGNSSCTQAVLSFLSSWAAELHAKGYLAGAYGSMASLMTDLSNTYNSTSYTRQDDVWFAHYNGEQSSTDSQSFPAFKDAYWSGRRLHQYLGGHQQTWGGVTINIDENWNAGQVSGTAVAVNYGANTWGPGSGGRFVFTGSMAYWRPNTSQGVKKMSYWTNSNGALEDNGATWSPSLRSGLYDVQAYVPQTSNPGVAPYTIQAVEGTFTRTIDQSQANGYVSLGQYRTLARTPLSVHVGDNDPSGTSKTIGVDAMRFEYIAAYPGAPTSVSASPGDSSATVSWNPADANDSPIIKYTITASPGGQQVVVGADETSVVVTGLTNDASYSFTVMATNGVGEGPASASTSPVTPHAGAGSYHSLSPQRILDTTKSLGGTTLRAGANQRVQIAGFGGVPAFGVSAVVLAVQALNQTTTSYLSLTPTSPSGTSQLNYDRGQQVGGLVHATLDGTGSLLMRAGAGQTDVIFDVLGYYGSDTAGAKQMSVNPTRIFNTTSSHQPIDARHPRTVRVAGVGSVPSNATAVVLSAQALNATYTGNDYLSITPSSPQAISQLNVSRGQHSSGLIVTGVGSGGNVLARIGHGTADVILDVTGYFTTSGGSDVYHPLSPFRAYQANGVSSAEGVRTVALPRLPDGVHAVMLSLQALNASANSYLSITPSSPAAISELNYPARKHVSGAAIVPVGPNNTVALRVGAGSADVIIDVAGYYGP